MTRWQTLKPVKGETYYELGNVFMCGDLMFFAMELPDDITIRPQAPMRDYLVRPWRVQVPMIQMSVMAILLEEK